MIGYSDYSISSPEDLSALQVAEEVFVPHHRARFEMPVWLDLLGALSRQYEPQSRQEDPHSPASIHAEHKQELHSIRERMLETNPKHLKIESKMLLNDRNEKSVSQSFASGRTHRGSGRLP